MTWETGREAPKSRLAYRLQDRKVNRLGRKGLGDDSTSQDVPREEPGP